MNANRTSIHELRGDVESDGSARTIMGYPAAEIQRLASEVSATPRESVEADQARERLKSGRNDPCPCGSGNLSNALPGVPSVG